MKKKTFFMMISILVVSMTVLIGTMPAYAAKGVDEKNKLINIAVVGPLTGQYGVYGQDQKKGVDFAIKLFNDAGGFKGGKYKGYKLKATYFDDKGDPKESANVAQQVVIGDFFVEIGPTNSSPANAAIPIYERSNMALVMVYATDYRLTHSGYKNVHRVVVMTATEGPGYTRQIVKTLGYKKIYEIWENTAYGQSVHQFFADAVKAIGAELVGDDTYTAGQDVDFKPILTKAKTKNPDIIHLNVTYNDGGLIISQARGMGWDIPMFAAQGCNAPKFVEMMPANPGKVYLSVAYNQLSTEPRIVNFIKEYTKFTRTEPSEAAALACDATNAVVNAIELGAEKREEMKDYLKKVDFQGVGYRIRFDENGDVIQPDFGLLQMGPGKKWVDYTK